MIGERFSDDEFRQLLETAAAAEPVPDDGIARLLGARDRLEKPLRRPRFSWPMVRKWVPATALALAVLVGGVVAVGARPDSPASSQGSYASPSRPDSGASSGGSRSGAAAPAPAAVPVPGTPVPGSRPPGVQPRIVQTGSVSLTVDDSGSAVALDRLAGVARGLGGYVAASASQSGGSGGNATVTLRVPVGAFDQALAQVSGLGRVTRSTTGAQDVTGEYVDLAARLKALQETRTTYLAILARAGTIDETLAVQQQITAVQTQIEQVQGQQQVLAGRSDLATLTVDVTEPDVDTSGTSSRSGFSGAGDRAVDGFAGGLQWLLAASGPVLLVALVVAVLFWPVRRLVRVLRRRLI